MGNTFFEEAKRIFGDRFQTDLLSKMLYATDASIYKKYPLGVCFPRSDEEIQKLIRLADNFNVPLIPRTAGTSLAGQCVGEGLIVDVSKHFTKIIEVNQAEKWVRVQPGVIRDELNQHLAPYGLFFGPNTSTSNRCMIGGMVGNGSSGSTSIKYGTTRDKTLEIKGFLSDGSRFSFGDSEPHSESQKEIEQALSSILQSEENLVCLQKNTPPKEIHRRNTGYALDVVAQMNPFSQNGPTLNWAKLLVGSEGTLAFTTEIKLQLDDLPPPEIELVAVHYSSIEESMKGAVEGMKHSPFACELMDKVILDCTKVSKAHSENRFFIEGDPAAILVFEFREENSTQLSEITQSFIEAHKKSGLGYAYPIIEKEASEKVWNLRKAGLGLLSNVPGDAKPLACIEDTAVKLDDLPVYIAEFAQLMERHKQQAVYYAHAGAGEIHLRPVLNLKTKEGVKALRDISYDTAQLVKKFNGSLSGEHGDGRVRAEFIEDMVGPEVYQLFRQVKQIFDPKNLFNPGKIVDAPKMDEDLRYTIQSDKEKAKEKTISTKMTFEGGIKIASEKCNGSGDCRKTEKTGGVMCPSYMALKDEKATTRGRANVLREVLTAKGLKGFHDPHLDEVLSDCLQCKGCSGECPSNVDVSSMKAETLYQKGRIPRSKKLMASYPEWGQHFKKVSGFLNFLQRQKLIKKAFPLLGLSPDRSLPQMASVSLKDWINHNPQWLNPENSASSIYLFVDEFSNINETEVGIYTVKLLYHLGIQTKIIEAKPSGRAHISVGNLNQAEKYAKENISLYHGLITQDTPLIGIEPSAISAFGDEYPKLTRDEDQRKALELSKHVYSLEKYLAKWLSDHPQKKSLFQENLRFSIHGHCHQKYMEGMVPIKKLFNSIPGWKGTTIPSGCCGMAGGFGMQKEKFDLSMKIGNLVLFPTVRKLDSDETLVATGTSCRHQILDGVQVKAISTAQALYESLKEK